MRLILKSYVINSDSESKNIPDRERFLQAPGVNSVKRLCQKKILAVPRAGGPFYSFLGAHSYSDFHPLCHKVVEVRFWKCGDRLDEKRCTSINQSVLMELFDLN